ncbi:MAG TPA: lysylphosphatidylglycerol synthase transmembrane domain-containing protein [Cyclobacteriaceae bacterium]|nr:lysylphosphatidylglycerol synthase transmembrane domain-containing protein [Cyclobacteriaceae bacterium]
MSPRLKVALQYIIILIVTILLILFSLSGLTVSEEENKWDYIVKTWRIADKGWLLLMFGFAMMSHIVRTMRWKMLLVPTGNNVTLKNGFLSLMVGYLVNLAIPRGGEVSRCYNLYKLNAVPVDVSFGTVVVERVVDLICLFLLVVLAFTLESKKLLAFIDTLPLHLSRASSRFSLFFYFAVAGIAGLLILYVLLRRNKKVIEFLQKIWVGMKSGLLSVFQLEHKGLFIFYSALIWIFYFFMSFCVIKAFPATEHLGFSAVISLFGIGSIAMAAPLPGGAGSYHVLVPQGLSFLYGIQLKDAVALTFIFHGWQTFIMIVAGSVSLMVTSFLVRRMTK